MSISQNMVCVAVASALAMACSTAEAQPTLTVSPDVVAPGSPVTATVTGPPGQFFAVVGSSVNAGMSYGGLSLGVGADFRGRGAPCGH